MNGHVFNSKNYLFHGVFNDLAFFVGSKLRPTGINVFGFIEDLIRGKVLDLQEVYLSLDFRKLAVYMLQPCTRDIYFTIINIGRQIEKIGAIEILIFKI